MKKTFARLFIILFLVSGVYFSEPPKKTEAFFIDIPNFIKEYGLDTLVTILQTRIINKMVNDTVNWAVGGFDGEPGFLNNWDDFLKDTSYAVIDSAFTNATRVALQAQQNADSGTMLCEEQILEPFLPQPCEEGANYDSCISQWESYNQQMNECQNSGVFGGLGGAAQQNYNMWKSGELTTTRAVAGTIARFGSQQLNYDPLSAIIKGEGETLTKLLGSQEQKDAFRHDFAAGGILGYIALADPHNSALGRSGLTQQFLSGKAGGAVSKAVDSLQTPQKMLDRTDCEEFEKDIDGNDTSTCKRAVTTTPGDVVAQKLHTNLVKEEDQSIVARELSDVLAKAVGRLTNSLLQQGLDKVTQKKPSSGGGGEAPVRGSEFGDGNYQSSYDVLGLSDDGESGSQGTGGNQGGGNQPYNPDQPFNTDIVDGSAPFVGGPEDAKGQRWDSGPELIINLQEVLEPAINNTRKELEFYLEAERIMKRFKDLIIQLDRCVPGPDYDWQERVNDRFDVDSDEHNDANLRKLAIAEMKQMTRDSRVNIPGAMRMLGMVVTTLKSGDEDQKGILQMKDKKQNILINLLNIRSGVEIDFNRYKEAIHHNLPLFSDQWDKLSPAQQLELFSLPLMDMDGNLITPEAGEDPYLMGRYYLFKSEADETPASVYESRPDVAKKAVISYAWDLWRTKKGEEPATDTVSGAKQKSNLRYRYYIMQNSISTQANVLEAELTKDEAIAGGKTLIGYLSDCAQLAAYSLGVDYGLVTEALQTDGLGRLPREGGGGILQRVSARNGKSDADIKQFILAERAKQSARNPDDPSIFVTDVITSEGSLSESILGFNSEEEKMNYFNDFYPYEGQNFPPATSIVPLLQSNYARSFMPLGGMIPGGYALCRFTTTWRTIDCLDRWYWTKSLEYEMIMAGV